MTTLATLLLGIVCGFALGIAAFHSIVGERIESLEARFGQETAALESRLKAHFSGGIKIAWDDLMADAAKVAAGTVASVQADTAAAVAAVKADAAKL